MSKRYTTESFVEMLNEIYKDKNYDFSEVEYVNSQTNVQIKCLEHGWYSKTPNLLQQGRGGCQSCGLTGYDPSKPGNFYVMLFGDFTKVGITNRTTEARARELKSRNKHEYTVVLSQFFEDGRLAKTLESKVLKFLKQKYNTPTRKFEGSSESFMSVDLKELLKFINSTKGNNNV